MKHQGLFEGNSEMHEMMRSREWSNTSLGAVANWPQTLRIAVQIMLSSQFPIQILWGAEYILLYNDAYRPILGNKHPQSLGQRGQVCWQEVWDFALPRLERVKTTGMAEGEDDQFLLLERNGYLEECYFTFSYAPLYTDNGSVGGVFNEVNETTRKVIVERRQKLQNSFATRVTSATTTEEVYNLAAEILAGNPADIPVALFYAFDRMDQHAFLTSTVGFGSNATLPGIIPTAVNLSEGTPDRQLDECLAKVLKTGAPLRLELPQTGWEDLPTGHWGSPIQTLLTLPLKLPQDQALLGFMIAGVSPHRELDQNYQDFFVAIAGQLSFAIAHTLAYEKERQRVALLAELNQSNETVQAALQEQAQLLDLALDPILVRHLDHTITYWNRGAAEVYGWTKQEAMGRVSHTLFQTEFPRPLAEIEAELLQRDRWSGELVQRVRDGRTIVVMSHWVLKRDAVGNPIAILETNHDITNRKLANDALRSALQRLNFHMENTPLAVIEWSRELVVMRWSTMAEQMFGWQAEELLGNKLGDWQFVFEDDQAQIEASVHSVFENKVARTFLDNRNYTKSGRIIRCHWYNSVLLDAAGNVQSILSLVQDVTERKRIEAERENLLEREHEARTQAETANRIKDEFLAVLSHELRSPLNPILGWSKLLRTGKLDAEKTDQALESIERNARLQVQLIEDLLDVSRILRGKLSLSKNPVDLKLVILAAIETVRLTAETKQIEIQFNFEPDTPSLFVCGDSARLQQIVWNLLSNAVKFTPEGGRVEVRLEQLETSTIPTACITVNDSGKGISPDFLPHVFDYFRQADATTTRTFGGLGLGLAIVQHLVQLHNGSVHAASPGEGQGATFTVNLPLMQAVNPEIDPIITEPFLRSHLLQDIRILVVDDELDSQQLVRFVLSEVGAEVIAVSSAGEALKSLAAASVDVVVSDVGMPEMDGYALMREIHTLYANRKIPVPVAIALTAYAGETDRQQSSQAGFQAHLSKPFDADELVITIASLLQLDSLNV